MTCEELLIGNSSAFCGSLNQRAPIYLPGATPIFSNAGYQVHAYAQESITGNFLETMRKESILQHLDMKHTGLSSLPNSGNVVIPANASTSG